MIHRRISVLLQCIFVVALTILSSRCANAAAEHEEETSFIIDPTAADNGSGGAASHSTLRKRDLGLGNNGVDPNGLGSIFGNQGQNGQSVPPRRHGPPMTKAEREQALATRKQKIQAAITAMKTSKIKTVGTVQPTQDELDQINAPTPVGEAKLLGYSRTIDDVEDTTLFDPESGTATKCVTSGVDGGLRLLLSGGSSSTVQVFNPDLPGEAHIFTIALLDGNDDSWTNTVRTEAGNRVCIQAINGNLPSIKEAAYVILGGGRRRELMEEEETRQLTCSYNQPCIEPAGTPSSNDCGGYTHSTAVDDARMSVAGIIFQSSFDGKTYGCSGSLINGGINDDLFLTAYHCINTPSEASSIDFFLFEYEECGACNGGFANAMNGAGGKPSQVGAVIMNTYPATDATILRLKGVAPQGAVSLGYSTSPVASSHRTDLYRISHPALGHQAYTELKVDINRPQCDGLARGNIIYSSDTYGATEGGSSGSPLVNSAGQIVGQLYGACGLSPRDVCNKIKGKNPYLSRYDDASIDGALAVSYENAFHFWLSVPATCIPAGQPDQPSCGPTTPCCSGTGNCSSDAKCSSWIYESPTPTCSDGKQNGNEAGIDCGGPDCQACQSCSDGVQNGNETGTDCGGSCPACPSPPSGDPCITSGSYPPSSCSECCSNECHTNRRKKGQCK